MFGDDVLFLQRFLKSIGYYQGKLDGDYGPLTDAALNKFEEESDKIASQLGHFDLRSEKNITTLHPKAQTLARQFLKAVLVSNELKN